MKWKVKNTKYIVNDQWIKLRADTCMMPNGTILDPYYVLEHTDWVNVVAITEDQKILMVRQYRHGIGKVVVELPAGCVDTHDINSERTIRRELLEETGFTADEFLLTGKMPLNTSNHNNYTYSYLARDVKKIQFATPDATEDLEILELSFEEVYKLIEDGELQALHTASFLLAVRHLAQ